MCPAPPRRAGATLAAAAVGSLQPQPERESRLPPRPRELRAAACASPAPAARDSSTAAQQGVLRPPRARGTRPRSHRLAACFSPLRDPGHAARLSRTVCSRHALCPRRAPRDSFFFRTHKSALAKLPQILTAGFGS